mmetsp:Transcript_2032/g.4117  ORF Transcript_2032/g.4117 Transcript_2032/m.4117 type:complete len:536 (+) Transcript_2032:78-1685(+)
MGVFEDCAVQTEGGGHDLLLQCVADALDAAFEEQEGSLLSWLLVLCGGLVFFMQAGFAMLCAGCVRKKNVQNSMLKNLLDACGAALAFLTLGYGFAFGGQGDTVGMTFIGKTDFFSKGEIDQAFWFFQFAFSATAVTIVAGTLAERCQMVAYLLYSFFLTGFVYPVVAHAIWSNNGFLSAFTAEPFNDIGVVDFAGSGVVHLTGGSTALIATWILGARKGRFHDDRGRLLPEPRTIHGHSMALQLMGTMVLWFGWYGFNCGSALLLGADDSGKVGALAAVNTSLAAAAGCVSSLFLELYLHERRTGEYTFDLSKAMNGALGALVAVTAPCGTIENWAAVVIGVIAGFVYLGCSKLLIKVRLDDAVDAIPVHMANGMWGLIATGLFTSPGRLLDAYGTDVHVGWFYSGGDAKLLLNQFLAVGFILIWVFVMMVPFFVWLNMMGWFRADSLEELVGLDLSYMGTRQSLLMQADDDISDVGSHGASLTRQKRETEQEDLSETESLAHEKVPPEQAKERRRSPMRIRARSPERSETSMA